MSGFGNLKPRTANKDSVRLEEVIETHKWPADEWSQVRFLPGKILPVKRHWITILAGKEKKEITIPRYCIAFDPNNENEPRKDKSGKPIKCPYCELTHGNDGSARYEFFYLANAIIRELEEDEPRKKAPHTKEEKKTGFKDIRSKSWTPVRVCRITSSVATRIQELNEGNLVKDKKKGTKKAYDVTHEKYGIDIRLKYKPKASGTDKYSADKDERTPLTEEQQGYLKWKLDEDLIDVTGRMDPKQAVEDFKRMEIVGGDEVDDDDDGYSLDDDKKKKKKKKKKGKEAFSDDDDDDKPSKKSKKKKKPAFSDDDDDDDDKPSKKSKKSKVADKGKKKSKSKSDDDDDDDEPKSKKKKVEKKKPSKKSKVAEKTTKKKSKKNDDDDDDEPKSKKSKSKKDAPKSKKDTGKKKKPKKKSTAWDDDDE